TFATLRTSTEPRELKRFQQLNAVRIQGVIPPNVSLDQALHFLESEAARILPPGFTVDYAGESRQLRTEGSRFIWITLVSGMIIGTFFTLFVVPAVYMLVAHSKERVEVREEAPETVVGEPAVA